MLRHFDWYHQAEVGWFVVFIRGIDLEWRKASPGTVIVDKRYSYQHAGWLVGVQMPGHPVYWYSLAEVRAHSPERLEQIEAGKASFELRSWIEGGQTCIGQSEAKQ